MGTSAAGFESTWSTLVNLLMNLTMERDGVWTIQFKGLSVKQELGIRHWPWDT